MALICRGDKMFIRVWMKKHWHREIRGKSLARGKVSPARRVKGASRKIRKGGTNAGRVGTAHLLFSLHPLERIDAQGVDGGAACASCVDDLLISRRTKMAHEASIDGLVTRARWNPDSFYFPAHVLLHQTSRYTRLGLVPLARLRIPIIVCRLNEICNSVSRNSVFNKLRI